MIEHQSWRPKYAAMCPQPGPLDVYLAVLVNGKRIALRSVTDYLRLRELAPQLAETHRCQVKVLPMSALEVLNFYGVVPEPARSMDTLEPAFRQQAIRNFMDVLHTSTEPHQRDEALDMLKKMGALNEG